MARHKEMQPILSVEEASEARNTDLNNKTGEGLCDDLQQLWGILSSAEVEGCHDKPSDAMQVTSNHFKR